MASSYINCAVLPPFERLPTGIELTNAGRRLLPEGNNEVVIRSLIDSGIGAGLMREDEIPIQALRDLVGEVWDLEEREVPLDDRTTAHA